MYDDDMKISRITSRLFFYPAGLMLAGLLISCGSAGVEKAAVPDEPAPAPKEEPPPVVERPAVSPRLDDEYSRSIGSVAVSRDAFLEDKEKILRIISELDVIINDMNYNSWITYIDKDSVNYWKLRSNLAKAEKRLPGKGLIKLKDLQDYFKWVFVPARKGKTVTEIRYISDKYINAVQVQQGQEDLICYYFTKSDGRWMVRLPTNEELN